MWSSWFLGWEDSTRCLVDSSDSTKQPWTVLVSLLWCSLRLCKHFRDAIWSFFSCKEWRLPQVFPVFFTRFREFLGILRHLVRKSKFLSVSEHCGACVSRLPIPVFHDFERLYKILPILLAIHDLVWQSFVFCVNLSPDHMYHFRRDKTKCSKLAGQRSGYTAGAQISLVARQKCLHRSSSKFHMASRRALTEIRTWKNIEQ